MTYGELQNVVQSLNTGATNPDLIGTITKLVLGKMARRKLKSRIKLASVTTSGSTSLNLTTLVPDFFDFKIDIQDNRPKCVYYLQDGYPIWFELTDNATFTSHTEGGYATLVGKTLKFNMPAGEGAPNTIYFPYYSFYLVLDADGTTEKSTPSDNADTFLISDTAEDVLVEGILLYISRREKEDAEYTKNVQEWEKRINEMVFYL